MSRRRLTLIHVFIWLFALFADLPYGIIGQRLQPHQIVTMLIGYLYLMVVFYLFYLVLVPAFLNKKKLSEFFLFSFLIVLLMPFFGYTILFFSRALFDDNFNNFYRGYSLKMHMSGFYAVLIAAVFGSLFRSVISWFATMNQKAETDSQKLAVELELLKSKLNPHFLFNTLNNIDSLIQKDPDEASAALIRLSEMMRYMTYETSSQYVELGKEIEYIRNFIDLYRMRIRTPDDIKLELSGDQTIMISPALFVPLLENAFKFAGFKGNKPYVDIKLKSENGIVDFRISNFYRDDAGKTESSDSGYGIINLRKRLELIYPGKHELLIDAGKLQYNVNLKIDTNAD